MLSHEIHWRERLNRIQVDVAITRTKVESIEKSLAAMREETISHNGRLGALERKMFSLWLIGPLFLGVAAFFNTIRTWLLEQ